MAKIYFYSDENELMEAEVSPAVPEVVIGRHSTCQIRSAGQSVSRRHARVWIAAGGYWLQDMGSSNGTFLAGDRLTPEQSVQLVHEALFACGQFELRLSYDDEDFDLEAAGWPDPTSTVRSHIPPTTGAIPPPPNIPPPPGFVPPPPPSVAPPVAFVPPPPPSGPAEPGESELAAAAPPAPAARRDPGDTASKLGAWLQADSGAVPAVSVQATAAELQAAPFPPPLAPSPAAAPVSPWEPTEAAVEAEPAALSLAAAAAFDEEEPESARFPVYDPTSPATHLPAPLAEVLRKSQAPEPSSVPAPALAAPSAGSDELQAALLDAREQLAGERLARRLAEADMEVAETKAAVLEEEAASLRQKLQEGEAARTALAAQAAELQTALDDANAALADWQGAVEQWQAQCAALEQAIAELQAGHG